MEKQKTLTPLKRFFNLLEVDRQEILSIYVYALFNGMITLSLPLGIQAIINLISGGQVSTSWIVLVVIVIIGVALSGVMQILQLSITENLQQKIFTRSAFEFAYRIPKLELESVDKTYMPEMVNRFFDTLTVQKGLSKILVDFSSASLQVIFGLILLSIYHPFFILFSAVLVMILYLIFRFTAPNGLRTSLVESKYKYEVVHWLEEIARAMETFKLAGKSQLPMTKTDEAVTDYLTARKAHFKTLVFQYINLTGFKVIVAAGLLLIGSLLVFNQQMNIGQFVASEIIIILVLASVEKLILSMETIYDVLTSIEKIGTVTDIPLEPNTGVKNDIEINGGLALYLNNLSYKFDPTQEPLLNIDRFRLNSGEKVCLSGFNGSGKSLFLQVIAGLYNRYSGTLTYNNIPLGNWCKDDLRSLIGDSLAREDIFNGTLHENLVLGKPDVALKEIQAAVDVVGLTSFVESLPLGYNTLMVPEGKTLPKNVRLKIMLARCLIGAPKLILLEDNFNQLNKQEKNKLIDHLMQLDTTIIAVSNDPEIANKFQKTLVLNQGEVFAFDAYQNLKNQSWSHQLFQTN